MTLIIMLICIIPIVYMCQLLYVWASFLTGDITTKKEFLSWHIPIMPFIQFFIERFKELK